MAQFEELKQAVKYLFTSLYYPGNCNICYGPL